MAQLNEIIHGHQAKVLADLDREIKTPGASLRTKLRHQLDKMTRRARVRIDFPQTMASLNQHSQTKAPLCNAPFDIQCEIFKRLTNDADKACLALTCKQMASTYSASRYGFTKGASIKKHERVTFLLRLRSMPMFRFRRVCFTCGVYVPWAGRWGGNKNLWVASVVTPGLLKQGPRCRECMKLEQKSVTEARRALRDIKKMLKGAS